MINKKQNKKKINVIKKDNGLRSQTRGFKSKTEGARPNGLSKQTNNPKGRALDQSQQFDSIGSHLM